MDTSEAERWAFTMDSGGTAKLLFVLGAISLSAASPGRYFAYTNDNFVMPAGIASTSARCSPAGCCGWPSR